MQDVYITENLEVSEEFLIRGLVIPSEWNEAGKVIGVCIKTFDEDEYFLSDIEATMELLKLIQQEVLVKGMVKITNHKKYLTMCNIITGQPL